MSKSNATAAEKKIMETTAAELARLAALETDVSGLKSDIAGLDTRLGHLDGKIEAGFARLFERVEKTSRRETPWAIIFGAAGIAATIAIAVAGWANAYFGQGIAGAIREAQFTSQQLVTVVDEVKGLQEHAIKARIDTAVLTERSERNRAEIDTLRQNERMRAYERPASSPASHLPD